MFYEPWGGAGPQAAVGKQCLHLAAPVMIETFRRCKRQHGYVNVNTAPSVRLPRRPCQRLHRNERQFRTAGGGSMSSETEQRVTLRDVARAAGVSTATVTRTLQ